MYDEKFQIRPLHDHCRVESTSNFENILAAAATDHLGACSRDLRSATAQECKEIAEVLVVRANTAPMRSCQATSPDVQIAASTTIISSRTGSTALRGIGVLSRRGQRRGCSGWDA